MKSSTVAFHILISYVILTWRGTNAPGDVSPKITIKVCNTDAKQEILGYSSPEVIKHFSVNVYENAKYIVIFIFSSRGIFMLRYV